MEFDKDEHPSFGMMSISRYSSSHDEEFFGSSITQNGGIIINIGHGSVSRKYNKDYFFMEDTVLELKMSNTQFAELITNLNNGGGLPCTITRLNGKRIEGEPIQNKRKQFVNDFKESMKTEAERLEILNECISELEDKGRAGKNDIKALRQRFNSAKQQIESNIPFVAKSFNEQMDKTVKEAKGEIEGYLQNKIQHLGIESLKEQFNVKLIENDEYVDVDQLEGKN